jgi:hypothetical protein
MNFPTSQTPPPPPPYPPSEPVGPGLSEPERLINVYFAPSKTFIDIRQNASWWVPLLLISIVTISFFLMIDHKVGFDRVAGTMMANNSRMQQASPEQQEQAIKFTALSLKIGGYASPLFVLLYAVIIAAVLMATFNFGMDAQVPFSRAIAIVLYGWMVTLVGTILTIITLALGNPEGFRMENPVGTNPAYFMDFNSTSKFLYVMLSSLDVISLWAAAVIGLGFAVNARKRISTGTAVGVVVGWYFVYKLISAGFASLR